MSFPPKKDWPNAACLAAKHNDFSKCCCSDPWGNYMLSLISCVRKVLFERQLSLLHSGIFPVKLLLKSWPPAPFLCAYRLDWGNDGLHYCQRWIFETNSLLPRQQIVITTRHCLGMATVVPAGGGAPGAPQTTRNWSSSRRSYTSTHECRAQTPAVLITCDSLRNY